ncbi:MAG: arginine deiminase family protein [Actinomycetota bacterium]
MIDVTHTGSAPSTSFGVRSSVAPLRRVAVRGPGAILTADPDRWHYDGPLDPTRLAAEHAQFVEAVSAAGATVEWFDDDPGDDLADSVFTYDPSFVVGSGAVVLRPGKQLRAPEAELHEAFYERLGIPVLGRIEAPGTVEGGDCFWLDDHTLAVGRGFRTNDAGIDQLRDIVAADRIEVEVFDLPYHLGPEACLHLMSLVSMLDDDLALVHAALLPTPLWQRLRARGVELLVAPPDEFDASQGLNLNVLATGPRSLIAIDGFPDTVGILRGAGCDVTLVPGGGLCIPCEGGPTCLTRPLERR